METTMIDWSSLPRDLLVSIAKLTVMMSVKAFMAFRSTCSSWNEAAGDEDCVKLFKWPRVPFLMIPDKAEFYSLSRNKSYGLRTFLPEGKSRKFIESRFGWILTLETSGKTHLLYPFSETWIQLPNYKTLPEFEEWFLPWKLNCQFIRRSVLSANPSQTSDYVLVVLTQVGYMAFWRPGNQNWTKISESILYSLGLLFIDLVFYSMDSKFYAITVGLSPNVQIWAWDMNNDSAVQVTVEELEIVGLHLVESSAGELLMVGIINDYSQVHRLDFINGVWERMTSLKDAIFVGNTSASFSILPDGDDPVIRSNCMYFIYNNGHNSYNGIHNLEDGSNQRFSKKLDRTCSHTSFPLWICPSSSSFMASLDHGSTVPDQQPGLVKMMAFVVTLTFIGYRCYEKLKTSRS